MVIFRWFPNQWIVIKDIHLKKLILEIGDLLIESKGISSLKPEKPDDFSEKAEKGAQSTSISKIKYDLNNGV